MPGYLCQICGKSYPYWIRFQWHLFDHCANNERWLKCNTCDQRRLYGKKSDYLREMCHDCIREDADFTTSHVVFDLKSCMEYLRSLGADQARLDGNYREYQTMAANTVRKQTNPDKVATTQRKARSDKGVIRSVLPTSKMYSEKQEKRSITIQTSSKKDSKEKYDTTTSSKESKTSYTQESESSKVPSSTTTEMDLKSHGNKGASSQDKDTRASPSENWEGYNYDVLRDTPERRRRTFGKPPMTIHKEVESDEEWLKDSPGISLEEENNKIVTKGLTPVKRKSDEQKVESGKKRKEEKTETTSKHTRSRKKLSKSETENLERVINQVAEIKVDQNEEPKTTKTKSLSKPSPKKSDKEASENNTNELQETKQESKEKDKVIIPKDKKDDEPVSKKEVIVPPKKMEGKEKPKDEVTLTEHEELSKIFKTNVAKPESDLVTGKEMEEDLGINKEKETTKKDIKQVKPFTFTGIRNEKDVRNKNEIKRTPQVPIPTDKWNDLDDVIVLRYWKCKDNIKIWEELHTGIHLTQSQRSEYKELTDKKDECEMKAKAILRKVVRPKVDLELLGEEDFDKRVENILAQHPDSIFARAKSRRNRGLIPSVNPEIDSDSDNILNVSLESCKERDIKVKTTNSKGFDRKPCDVCTKSQKVENKRYKADMAFMSDIFGRLNVSKEDMEKVKEETAIIVIQPDDCLSVTATGKTIKWFPVTCRVSGQTRLLAYKPGAATKADILAAHPQYRMYETNLKLVEGNATPEKVVECAFKVRSMAFTKNNNTFNCESVSPTVSLEHEPDL